MTMRYRSIYLADETWGQLAEVARKEDRSVNWLVRAAIDAYLTAPGIVPPNIHSTTPSSESELVPEQLGPAVRVGGEPILPALKAVEVDLPDARWVDKPRWKTPHALIDSHRGITFCGRQTEFFGGGPNGAPVPSPTPPYACHDCKQAIAKAVREGRL